MTDETTKSAERDPEAILHSASFSSNAIRLSAREWLVAILIIALFTMFMPAVWKRIERFDVPADYRVPYELSYDYWTYRRCVDAAMDHDRILIVGDSVVWGEYVTPQQTLSHYLNELHGREQFANGGVNGTHPLALEGLVSNYAREVTDARVMLHCNLLWMSSADRDLQTDKETAFNHPRLVPQLLARIPSYKAPVEERLGVAIDHRVAYRAWVHHLRVAYFESLDVHRWTLEHPYEIPVPRVPLASPLPADAPHSTPISWTQRGMQSQDIPWIELESSLQWEAFRPTVQRLRDRKNRLFVLVGPFNEHLLTDESRQRYRALKQRVVDWLTDQEILHHVADLLPSEEFADASHPLSAGYARLARQLHASAEYQRWVAAP